MFFILIIAFNKDIEYFKFGGGDLRISGSSIIACSYRVHDAFSISEYYISTYRMSVCILVFLGILFRMSSSVI